jgi:hypothetical protein
MNPLLILIASLATSHAAHFPTVCHEAIRLDGSYKYPEGYPGLTYHDLPAGDYGGYAMRPVGLHDFELNKPVCAGDYPNKKGDRFTRCYPCSFAQGQPKPEPRGTNFQDNSQHQ